MDRPQSGGTHPVELAGPEDVPGIEAVVAAAYALYVPRLGRPPAPMTVDFATLVRNRRVHVLRVDGVVVGTVSLTPDGDALAVDELAVEPSMQKRGHGRTLMHHAEDLARRLGLAAVTLYTNERMHENVAFYHGLGFAEVDRRTQDGFARVFFRKELR